MNIQRESRKFQELERGISKSVCHCRAPESRAFLHKTLPCTSGRGRAGPSRPGSPWPRMWGHSLAQTSPRHQGGCMRSVSRARFRVLTSGRSVENTCLGLVLVELGYLMLFQFPVSWRGGEHKHIYGRSPRFSRWGNF